jgi:hypothetical protein
VLLLAVPPKMEATGSTETSVNTYKTGNGITTQKITADFHGLMTSVLRNEGSFDRSRFHSDKFVP